MGGLVEGFATFALETEVEEEDYNYQMKFLMLVILIKLLMIYVVSRFIWPRVMPAISSNFKANPGFVNLLGLSFIIQFLF
tara:strand:+ start:1187 stop:1426 length:240 start_codon:yes stop_codon:yes gene_type:complete